MHKNLPSAIGVIHFPPLPGNQDAPCIETVICNALHDLQAFEVGGMEGVIIENNYDLPHRMEIAPETLEAFLSIGQQIRDATMLSLGVCVLWNDYKAALSIAKHIHADFVRIPAYVDCMRTEYGVAEACAIDALRYRDEIGASHVAILADVHVKHAELISSGHLSASVEMATKQGANGIVITGRWTGDPPTIDDLHTAKIHAGGIPIYAGSGVSSSNVRSILAEADGFIASTSLKERGHGEHRQNIVDWSRRISVDRVQDLFRTMHS